MKITDVTVTLFAWDDLPARQFGRHTGRMPGGRSELGLVTIQTDQGVTATRFWVRRAGARISMPLPSSGF